MILTKIYGSLIFCDTIEFIFLHDRGVNLFINGIEIVFNGERVTLYFDFM